jgi:hypothetical protein
MQPQPKATGGEAAAPTPTPKHVSVEVAHTRPVGRFRKYPVRFGTGLTYQAWACELGTITSDSLQNLKRACKLLGWKSAAIQRNDGMPEWVSRDGCRTFTTYWWTPTRPRPTNMNNPIKCVVAARNANGSPDFLPVLVLCSPKQKEEGEHYEAATLHAQSHGYDPALVYDETDDGWNRLSPSFSWETVEKITT